MGQPGLFFDEAAAERALRALEVLAIAAMAHAKLVERPVGRLEPRGDETGQGGGEGCGCVSKARRSGHGVTIRFHLPALSVNLTVR